MTKIKKGDKVQVMRGKDAGKVGEVLKVVNTFNKRGVAVKKAVVAGVNIVKRAQKPNPQFGIKGGIIQFEKPVDVSNMMLIDPKTDKPARAGFKIVDGKKTRIIKKSGEVIK